MNADPAHADPDSVNQESQAIWDQNAEAWDAKMGAEGGAWQKTLIAPVTERLLDVHPGEWVLDVACGNGAFARRLAHLGATVTACDFSAQLIARARSYVSPEGGRIDYRVIDATNEAQLLSLGGAVFDAAVCTMALMDMTTIDPLLAALRRLLKPGGRFVFSVMHPCFNTHAVSKVATAVDRQGDLRTIYALQIEQYLGLAPARGLAIVEQPALQYYFHRPLSVLFTACFRAGLVMDALEEPVPAPPAGPVDCFDWANYREFPPVLVARLRLP